MKASSDFPAEVSQNNCEADFRWTFCTDCETETLSQVWQVSFSLFHSSFPSPHPLFPFDPPSSTTCQLTPIRAAVGWCGDGGGWGLGLGPPGYCLQLASPPYLSGLASLRHGGAGNLQHQLRVHHGLLIPGHTCSLCVCVCERDHFGLWSEKRFSSPEHICECRRISAKKWERGEAAGVSVRSHRVCGRSLVTKDGHLWLQNRHGPHEVTTLWHA